MKRAATSKLLATLAVLVLAAAGAAAASITTTRSTASPAEQVRTAERTLLKAVVDGDTATAGPLLASDFQLIDVLGATETRADYLATIGGGVDFVTLKPVSPIKVRLYGNAAIARYEAAFEVVAGPDRVKHRGWFTDLLQKRAGNWQLVWSQTTAIPNDPALFVQSLKPHA